MRRPVLIRGLAATCVCLLAATHERLVSASEHDDDVALGQQAYEELRTRGQIAESSRYLPTVRRVGARISAAARPHWFEERFYVARGNEINAFASPGGYVYVCEGLLRNVDYVDELAAVLGHETAHLVLGHLEAKSKQQKRKSSLLNIGRMLGQRAPQATTAVGAAGTVANLGYLNFTRQQEYAADELGVQLAAKAGYNPWGTVWFLRALEQLVGDAGYEQYVQQHPSTAERTARVESFIQAHRTQFGRWKDRPPAGGGLLD